MQLSAIATVPTSIIIVRIKAPINREIVRSTKARQCTASEPCTFPAEICRNGANHDRASKSIEKFSYLASLEEIQAQGFNLNIPRYVDTSEEEEEINLEGVFTELLSLETEEKQLKSELNEYFQQLGLNYEI